MEIALKQFVPPFLGTFASYNLVSYSLHRRGAGLPISKAQASPLFPSSSPRVLMSCSRGETTAIRHI